MGYKEEVIRRLRKMGYNVITDYIPGELAIITVALVVNKRTCYTTTISNFELITNPDIIDDIVGKINSMVKVCIE